MYRLSIYKSRITFPLCFAVHTWVVLESPEYGINRYEIHHASNKNTKDHFFVNTQNPHEGMSIMYVPYLWHSKNKFKSTCIYATEGEDTKETVLFLESEIQKYPFKKKYFLYPGPNSNTFTQWVIEKAGLAKRAQLPRNAFGKKYFFYTTSSIN